VSETPETDTVVAMPESGVDPFCALVHHSRNLERERDMLRKALADILKVEDAPLFRDHLTVHGGTTFWIDQKQGLAALDALQATAAKGDVQP
jgi:hypothetical protein